jgi:hypothetical protein
LKDALIGHCLQSQSKLTGLLNQNGHQELTDIYDLFKVTRQKLAVAPINLEELSSKISTCKESKENMTGTKDRFDPVREIYNTLSKFEVSVKDEEVQMLTNLDTAFEEFAVFISESEKLLEKSKVWIVIRIPLSPVCSVLLFCRCQ